LLNEQDQLGCLKVEIVDFELSFKMKSYSDWINGYGWG
jgi:hypothetical protein